MEEGSLGSGLETVRRIRSDKSGSRDGSLEPQIARSKAHVAKRSGRLGHRDGQTERDFRRLQLTVASH